MASKLKISHSDATYEFVAKQAILTLKKLIVSDRRRAADFITALIGDKLDTYITLEEDMLLAELYADGYVNLYGKVWYSRDGLISNGGGKPDLEAAKYHYEQVKNKFSYRVTKCSFQAISDIVQEFSLTAKTQLVKSFGRETLHQRLDYPWSTNGWTSRDNLNLNHVWFYLSLLTAAEPFETILGILQLDRNRRKELANGIGTLKLEEAIEQGKKMGKTLSNEALVSLSLNASTGNESAMKTIATKLEPGVALYMLSALEQLKEEDVSNTALKYMIELLESVYSS